MGGKGEGLLHTGSVRDGLQPVGNRRPVAYQGGLDSPSRVDVEDSKDQQRGGRLTVHHDIISYVSHYRIRCKSHG